VSFASIQGSPLQLRQGSYGKDKIETLIQKSKSYLYISSNQVKINALNALELASASQDTIYISLAYCYLGAAYSMDREYDTAYILLNTAEKYALLSKDKVPLVRVYNNIATIYEENKNTEKAFEYYSKAVSIIEENHITDLYLPLLSLSKYYCKKDEWTKADRLLNKVIENSKYNSDLFYQVVAQLNQIETRLFAGVIDLDQASISINEASEVVKNNGFNELNTRVLEVRLLLTIEKKQYNKALELVGDLPETNIKEIKKKRDYLNRIVKFHDRVLQEKSLYFLYFEINRLNNYILEKYEQELSLNSNAQYELANQQMIIDQIKSDKNIEELRHAQSKVYLNIGIACIVFLIIVLVIVFIKYNKSEGNDAVSDVLVHQAIHPDQKNELWDYLEYGPVYKLDSSFFYEEANLKFYELSEKPNIESLRGSNDYDLPWKDNFEELLKYYNELKINKQSLFIKDDLFNCNSELFLIPLIKSNQFAGILGFVIEKQIIKDSNNLLNETEELKSMTTKKNMNVLIVDDEEDNLILLKRYLKNEPFKVTTATNGVEALEEARKTEFGIILMDLEMPVKDGYDTVEEIKEINKNARVFALTAYTRSEIKREEIAFFDEIISKPVNKDLLINKL